MVEYVINMSNYGVPNPRMFDYTSYCFFIHQILLDVCNFVAPLWKNQRYDMGETSYKISDEITEIKMSRTHDNNDKNTNSKNKNKKKKKSNSIMTYKTAHYSVPRLGQHVKKQGSPPLTWTSSQEAAHGAPKRDAKRYSANSDIPRFQFMQNREINRKRGHFARLNLPYVYFLTFFTIMFGNITKQV